MNKLTKNEFDDALHKGLGRAFLFIREYGDNEVQEILLHSLIHNLVYDNQCEGGRGDWLFSIIEMTNNLEFYEEEILKNVKNVETWDTDQLLDSFWDTVQLLDLLMAFAKRGSNKARRALYDTFDTQKFNESWVGGDQIIEVDGLDGFLHIAERIGKRLKIEDGYWEDDFMLREVKERFGTDHVERAIHERSKESEDLRSYLQKIKITDSDKRETKEERLERYRKEYSLDKWLPALESPQGHFPFLAFARCASDEDILHCFALLKNETDKAKKIKLLNIFQRRALPEFYDPLLNFACDEDEELCSASIAALSLLRDERVHQLAIEINELSNLQRKIYSIPLFYNNYIHGDNFVIEKILKSVPVNSDRDVIHHLVFDLVKLCEKNKSSEMNQILLWIYENSPCMNCRGKGVKMLLENNALTESMLAECLDDGDSEIREIALQAKNIKASI